MLLVVVVSVLFVGNYGQSEEVDVAPRIINGLPAEPGQFPFIVSLQVASFGHVCGGSIVSSTWILTAAHCLHEGEAIDVVVGSLHKLHGGQRYREAQKIKHELYRPLDEIRNIPSINDIALLRVDRPIIFSNLVRPIGFGRAGFNEGVIAAGWGDGSGDTLKYLQMQTTQQCRDSRTICVQARNAGICHGDSGGPLIKEGRVVGVASYVEGSENRPCNAGLHDVYTRVEPFISWILARIRY